MPSAPELFAHILEDLRLELQGNVGARTLLPCFPDAGSGKEGYFPPPAKFLEKKVQVNQMVP